MTDEIEDPLSTSDITSLIHTEAFCREFFTVFVRNGYGSLPKREIDLLVLRLMIAHWRDGADSFRQTYDLARRLKLSPRRLRSMLDELAYRDDAKNDEWCRQQLKTALKSAEKIKDETWVHLQIDDGLVRDFATAKVREQFGIVDTSFNSAIIKLSGEKFVALVLSVVDQDIQRSVLTSIETVSSNVEADQQKSKNPIRLFVDAFAESAGEEAGKKSVSLGFTLLSGGLSDISSIVKSVFGKDG